MIKPDKLNTDEVRFMLTMAQQFNAGAEGETLARAAQGWIKRARTPLRRSLRAKAVDLFQAAILNAERQELLVTYACHGETLAA